jgi:hypothetical protein
MRLQFGTLLADIGLIDLPKDSLVCLTVSSQEGSNLKYHLFAPLKLTCNLFFSMGWLVWVLHPLIYRSEHSFGRMWAYQSSPSLTIFCDHEQTIPVQLRNESLRCILPLAKAPDAPYQSFCLRVVVHFTLVNVTNLKTNWWSLFAMMGLQSYFSRC